MSRNILFSIFIFFVARLTAVTHPALEHTQSWRQATCTMVARNFLEVDNNILHPRVDDNHGQTGITGMEFPLLNYIIYLVSLLFGYTHWYGRLINLVVSSIGTYYFYLIVRDFIKREVAFPATLLLLGSLWFSYGQKIMPDIFSLSFAIISLYYGLRYLFHGGIVQLILFALFFILGVLSKIPAILLPAFLCIPMHSPGIPLRRKLNVAIAGSVAIVPVIAWYFFYCPYLAAHYDSWYNSGVSISQGLHDILSLPSFMPIAHKFYFDALRFTGFAAFVAGVSLTLLRREKLLTVIFFTSVVLLILYAIKGGDFFVKQDYYILPYVPVMCLFAGYALSLVPSNALRYLLLAIIVIEGVADQQHDLKIPADQLYKLEAEQTADHFSRRNDLFAVNGGQNPTLLYFSHRKGWSIENDQLKDTTFIHSIARDGCRYLLIDRSAFGDKLPYREVYNNDHFTGYAL